MDKAKILAAIQRGGRTFRIAARANCSTRTARYHLKRLEGEGKIYRDPDHTYGNDIYWRAVEVPLHDEWLCSGCGDPVGTDGFSTCNCPTMALVRRGSIEIASKLRPCTWCGAHEFRATLDGEDLCQSCCHKWVRGEQPATLAIAPC